jgi:hypothetical protein
LVELGERHILGIYSFYAQRRQKSEPLKTMSRRIPCVRLPWRAAGATSQGQVTTQRSSTPPSSARAARPKSITSYIGAYFAKGKKYINRFCKWKIVETEKWCPSVARNQHIDARNN